MKMLPIAKALSFAKKRVKVFEGIKRYLDTGSVGQNRIIDFENVSFDDKPSRADLLVETGDLIVARMQSTNKVLQISDSNNDVIVSTGFLVLKANSGWNPNFLRHFLSSSLFQFQKDQFCVGATQKAINNSNFKKLVIPEISYENQIKIAAILDQADSLRNRRSEAIKLLDEYLQSVFMELFGDPITNKKNFRVVPLYELCSHIVDCPHSTPKYAISKTNFPCLRSSDLQNGFLDLSSTKYVDETQYRERIQRCTPLKNDIVYCREGARYGVCAYLPNDVTACLGQRTMLLRANGEIATPQFLWGLMTSPSIRFQGEGLVSGAAAPHINVRDIKAYKAFCPEMKLQKQFSAIFITIEKIKLQMSEQAKHMENQFNALFQKALAGVL